MNIVHKDMVEAFVEEAAKAYKETFNIELEAFSVQPSEGTYVKTKGK